MSTTTLEKNETVTIDENMAKAIEVVLENSSVKPNGTRLVTTEGYAKGLAIYGVKVEDVKKAQTAVNHMTTAIGHVAMADLEQRASELSADERADVEVLKKLAGKVRMPTTGGNTEVKIGALRVSNNPRAAADAPESEKKIFTYGPVDVTISAEGRIDRSFLDSTSDRVKKAMGIVN